MPLDGSTTGTASVTLPVKDAKRVAATARDKAASADISDIPQHSNRDLSGKLAASATPTPTGTGVVVRVCISGNDEWKAGKYEGTVSVYGPRFTEFSYPIIATQKWPLWVPLVILGVVLIPIGILEFLSDATTNGGTALYILVGLIAGFFTLGSQYTANDTWGDDWAKQIVALAIAAATAAVAGRAAATKFFSS